ncbi:TPA: hypothetical protein HA246_00420 [Candidatus Woesearchaeota archaeon]|nr:hypothetical protein [Candidatus Woesearchaeota archaeon]
MKSKLKEWLNRYLVAELISISFALIAAFLADILLHNPLITALAATWMSNVGFYGIIVFKDIKAKKKLHGKVSLQNYIKTLIGLIVEFGPAEYLDSFLIRPFILYIFPILLGSLSWGIFIGIMVANITYYLPVIISYEMKKKYLKF